MNIFPKYEKFCDGCHAHVFVGMLIANNHITSEDLRAQGNALDSIYYFSGGSSTRPVTFRIRILLKASYSG